jgi:hypothetical protein
MSQARTMPVVRNGNGHLGSNTSADDGDLAGAGNGTRPLVAAFDTGIRIYREERDVGEQGPMEWCGQYSEADRQGHLHRWRSGPGVEPPHRLVVPQTSEACWHDQDY